MTFCVTIHVCFLFFLILYFVTSLRIDHPSSIILLTNEFEPEPHAGEDDSERRTRPARSLNEFPSKITASSTGTVVDNQSPQIGYLGGKLMYRRDFFRIELQISKDVEKGISEVFPTSD